jgi:hypothetical protein
VKVAKTPKGRCHVCCKRNVVIVHRDMEGGVCQECFQKLWDNWHRGSAKVTLEQSELRDDS